jgi:hypothetical protein
VIVDVGVGAGVQPSGVQVADGVGKGVAVTTTGDGINLCAIEQAGVTKANRRINKKFFIMYSINPFLLIINIGVTLWWTQKVGQKYGFA